MIRPARRDRHGRGLRGALAPPQVPLSRSRARRFDELVLDAVERLERTWAAQLVDVEFAVEEVPPADRLGSSAAGADPVPLGRVFARSGTLAPRIVVFRRPIENRAVGERALAALVHDVVVEQVATLLGLEPETVDPGYGGPEDE